MKYSKKAWKCHECPERQENGCPAWMELVERNLDTDEKRITKGCLFAHLPRLLMYAEHGANTAASEVSAMRSQVVDGIRQVAQIAMQRAPQLEEGNPDAL